MIALSLIKMIATYRIQQTNGRWWYDMQRCVHILVVLTHVQHDTFIQWRCHSLSLNNGLTEFIDRLDHGLLKNMILFLASLITAFWILVEGKKSKKIELKQQNKSVALTNKWEREMKNDKNEEKCDFGFDFYSRRHVRWEMIVEFQCWRCWFLWCVQ